MTELKGDRVHEVFMDCLFKEDELEGVKPKEGDFVEVHGLMAKVGFHPERLEGYKGEIKDMLLELPGDIESFHARVERLRRGGAVEARAVHVADVAAPARGPGIHAVPRSPARTPGHLVGNPVLRAFPYVEIIMPIHPDLAQLQLGVDEDGSAGDQFAGSGETGQ